MLFNSFEFIFLFLPIVFFVYFFLNQNRLIIAAKGWLVFASLFFYSYWKLEYLPLILTSLIFNYSVGSTLTSNNLKVKITRKTLLIIGITFNLGLLGYFKYADFFIDNVNSLFHSNFAALNLILPLAISFFTFQQIAYLVDSYKGLTKEYNLLNYCIFVTFFPQLIAGPIVHHKEMMPQFETIKNKLKNYKHIAAGIFVFSIGLFKKICIADTFAIWATQGYDHATVLTLFEAWLCSLSYSFQLYFDFSGYTDMAMGGALLFNIKLPVNFNSPYKAINVQDFWKRWHVTLSRFLRDYLYIPLGGNRKGELNTFRNLVITFLLGGLWHGAGWTFVFWGLLHGIAQVFLRIWQKFKIPMPAALSWFITFNFINVTWVFFRATSWEDAIKVLKGMTGLTGVRLPGSFENILPTLRNYGFEFGRSMENINGNWSTLLFVIIALYIVVFCKNSNELLQEFKPSFKNFVFVLLIAIIAIMNLNKVSEFLYFNF
jgi:D-alanyl-lipoteichoic acid acyltransferase DltB (MBOAT superfamily)